MDIIFFGGSMRTFIVFLSLLNAVAFASTSKQNEEKGSLVADKIISYDAGSVEILRVKFVDADGRIFRIDGSVDQKKICKAFKYKELLKAGALAGGATERGQQFRAKINSKGGVDSPDDLIFDGPHSGQWVWGPVRCLK
jgi:hypothetical protein